MKCKNCMEEIILKKNPWKHTKHIGKRCKAEPGGIDIFEKAIKKIEAARKRMKTGKFLTEGEAKKRLGL